QVSRTHAVGEPRTHPPGRLRTLVLRDRLRGPCDQRALGALRKPALLVGVRVAVAEDLVAALAETLGDVGRAVVDRGVHLRLGGNPELVEQLEQAPDADAIAVVTPAIDAVALRLVRRRDRRALPFPKAKRFDVERDVDREPPAVG